MKVFVTGGSGRIGSNVVEQLVAAGHTVTGLARSEASASKLVSLGATPVHGTHTSLSVLAEAASAADAVIHCAFNHDVLLSGTPNGLEQANDEDRAAITAMCDALLSSGSGKTFINSSGLLINITEDEFSPIPEGSLHAARGLAEKLLLTYSDKGVRTINIRLSPVVHSADAEHIFIMGLIAAAKKNGYVGNVDGANNVWPAAILQHFMSLHSPLVQKVKSGSNLNGAVEEGIPTRDITEFIAKKMGLETKNVPPAEAIDRLGFVGMVLQKGRKVTNKYTKEWTGWEPTGPGLFEDLETYSF
ncbi:NAD-dependent epimerase/dehydratase [Flagelloscypha sp. PMI_526]|nr:NAD-dependent epimerase/dehydratase [Flagelloscypha sp. PMI_526]